LLQSTGMHSAIVAIDRHWHPIDIASDRLKCN
jgi:hypothetical protein